VLTASGAKNAALPILAATLLTSGACSLGAVPVLRDITTMLTLLTSLGAKTERRHDGEVLIDSGSVQQFTAPYDLVKTNARLHPRVGSTAGKARASARFISRGLCDRQPPCRPAYLRA
jgi:UDP-N-acetylglucosamine enolpyruvyl transferase